jgi:hypothetical protein
MPEEEAQKRINPKPWLFARDFSVPFRVFGGFFLVIGVAMLLMGVITAAKGGLDVQVVLIWFCQAASWFAKKKVNRLLALTHREMGENR